MEEGEDLIGQKTGEADKDDDRKYLVEIPEASLRFDDLGEAAFHADEFRDDQPCPRPAEKDAEVVVEVWHDAGEDDTADELARFRTQRLRGLQQGGI